MFLFHLLVVMHDRAVVVAGSLVQSVDFVKVVLHSWILKKTTTTKTELSWDPAVCNHYACIQSTRVLTYIVVKGIVWHFWYKCLFAFFQIPRNVKLQSYPLKVTSSTQTGNDSRKQTNQGWRSQVQCGCSRRGRIASARGGSRAHGAPRAGRCGGKRSRSVTGTDPARCQDDRCRSSTCDDSGQISVHSLNSLVS